MAVTYLIRQSCVWSLSPLNDEYPTYLSISVHHMWVHAYEGLICGSQ